MQLRSSRSAALNSAGCQGHPCALLLSATSLPPAWQVALARKAGFADAVHYELAGGLMGVLVGTRRQ